VRTKRKRPSHHAAVAELQTLSGQLLELKYSLEEALSKATKHLSILSFNSNPDPDGDRFRGWCAAELDKRNTGKADIPGIPAVIRAAHIKDLEAWVSETLRRAEAARATAFATCFDGDHTRNVAARWPALRHEE
jgi:hypothetical protein